MGHRGFALGPRGFLDTNMLVFPSGVWVADVIQALVHLVGIAMVGVRVPAGATKKGTWVDPCTGGAPKVQRNTTTLEDLDVNREVNTKKNTKKTPPESG